MEMYEFIQYIDRLMNVQYSIGSIEMHFVNNLRI